MASSVSAVVLSADEVKVRLPGMVVVPHVSRFVDAAGLLDARLAAIERVDTEWFFFLDDDDELPHDHLRVIERCTATHGALAYTDEIVTNSSSAQRRRCAALYSEDAFIADPMLLHHLVVCRTAAARRASAVVPRGTYAFENLLYFQAAKEGAEYVPEIGYVWHRRAGLSRHPSLVIGQVQSSIWADRNRSPDK